VSSGYLSTSLRYLLLFLLGNIIGEDDFMSGVSIFYGILVSSWLEVAPCSSSSEYLAWMPTSLSSFPSTDSSSSLSEDYRPTCDRFDNLPDIWLALFECRLVIILGSFILAAIMSSSLSVLTRVKAWSSKGSSFWKGSWYRQDFFDCLFLEEISITNGVLYLDILLMIPGWEKYCNDSHH
jgi:hypothetical protein